MTDDLGRIGQELANNSISVAEVLNNLKFEDYRILAGEGGLKNRCWHMVVLETPEGIEWLTGGEFLLTSGFAFKDNPEALNTVIARAHKMGVAAIAVKEKRYLHNVPQGMLDKANYYNLPLISLPREAIYTDKIAAFYEALFYIKNEYLIQAKNLDERLLNLVFDKKRADEVVVGLSGLTNASIAVYDAAFFEVSSCLIKQEHKEVLENAIKVDLYSEMQKINKNYGIELNGKTYYVNYFLMQSSGAATYMNVVSDMEIGILQENAIRYGCLIFSLKVKKEEQQSLKEIKIKRSLTELILNNANLKVDFYNSIEYDYSWNVKKNAIGLIISSEYTKNVADCNEAQNMKLYLYNIINRIFDRMEYLITERQNSIIVFFGIDQIGDVDQMLNTIKLYLKKYESDHIRITYGVSRMFKSIRDIPLMYNDCMVTTMFDKRNEITYYDSLDTVKLIYPLRDDKQLLEYYRKTIEVLADYDEKYGGELIRTLNCFFKCNMNKKDTANSLFIHVETLRYRLNKIEQLTGCTLDTSEGLLILQLGIKLHCIMANSI